jgi:cytochrome c biogenesis protein
MSMSSSEVASDLSLINGLWKALASLKLTIVLLLTLAATSIIGTLIPQNENPAAYVQAFGEFGYRLFALLGLFDMYHSWWFRSLILSLTANIVVCSIDRLQLTWKIIFVRHPKFNIDRFRRLKRKEEFKTERDLDQLKKIYPSIVARRFNYQRVEDTDQGFAIYGESGRLTRLGVYIVHFSVVLLLIGGLIGSIFGFDGFVNIPEGESARTIQLRNRTQKLQLDFEIRCDDFNVTFYDSGAPKEFRSSLTILKQGKPVYQKDIIVNDPLQYEGIRFFQASYGSLPPNEVMLNLSSKATGMIYSRKAAIDKPIVIPENLGTFTLKRFTRAADFKGQNIGEAFIGILMPPNSNPVEVTLPLRFPRFDRMRKGDVVIAIADYLPRYYTGLQVSRDPGVWVVYSGFILMIIGIYITFFMSHKQVCVEVTADGKKSRIMVAGTANKNKTGMENKVSNLSEKLAETAASTDGEAGN